MKRWGPILFSLFYSTLFFAQTTISGIVVNQNRNPVPRVNVYLQGTYDGGTTDKNGAFSFETSTMGEQTLMVSFITFKPYLLTKDVSEMANLEIVMQEEGNSLKTVTLSAGSFTAGDNSAISALKPLDIVTTASAVGDVLGALQTLPGTSTVAEDGRMFVRGGDAGETQIFIDGIRVFTPYTHTANNVPARSRYSPFLFDGITFSTGGYSAEYGQALSSVLLLNTIDEPDQTQTNISIMNLGGGVGHTEKWDQRSLSLNTSYLNLVPYHTLFPDRNHWVKPYENAGGEAVFRQKTEKGLLKLYSAFDHSSFKLKQEDMNSSDLVQLQSKNQNFYTNTSFSSRYKQGWSFFTGGSFTYGKMSLRRDDQHITDSERAAHFKIKVTKRFNNFFKLHTGIEDLITNFTEDGQSPESHFIPKVNNNITAAFAESDILFSRKLALKAGVRNEYSQLQKDFSLSPRVSLAYKTSQKSQLSLAYGKFLQQPENKLLKFDDQLKSQQARHYILNYQYAANHRILRAELFRKDYRRLVTYSSPYPNSKTSLTNKGYGFAQGLDVFWRDEESISNLDYWISYSYLDTQRRFQNYPIEAMPSFANRHNLSVVAKYWIDNWRSQLGMSYQYASGRTYTDLNTPGFLQHKTKSYNNISLNWAYLISQQKILYVSVSNVFGFKNITGYQYANRPDADGFFARKTLRPAADQFLFVGFFWTLSSDQKANQLDNL